VAARPIYQVTLRKDETKIFGTPAKYIGTSMSAAHVSGVAAMVLATGAINPLLPPQTQVDVLTKILRRTARDLGLPRTQQGAGLIDAAAATEVWPRFGPPSAAS
jgi:subtilisin family serine protease